MQTAQGVLALHLLPEGVLGQERLRQGPALLVQGQLQQVLLVQLLFLHAVM